MITAVEVLKKRCHKLEKLTDLLSAFTALRAMEEYSDLKVQEYKSSLKQPTEPNGYAKFQTAKDCRACLHYTDYSSKNNECETCDDYFSGFKSKYPESNPNYEFENKFPNL